MNYRQGSSKILIVSAIMLGTILVGGLGAFVFLKREMSVANTVDIRKVGKVEQIASYSCEGFAIDLLFQVQDPGFPVGPTFRYALIKSDASDVEKEIYYSGPLRGTQGAMSDYDYLPLPANIPEMPVKIFERPDSSRMEREQTYYPALINIFLSPAEFSKYEFDAISDCLDRNHLSLNDDIAALSSSIYEPQLKASYRPERLGGIAYFDQRALTSATIKFTDDFGYAEDSYRSLQLNLHGVRVLGGV